MYHLLMKSNKYFTIWHTDESDIVIEYIKLTEQLSKCIDEVTFINATPYTCTRTQFLQINPHIKLITSFPSLPFSDHFPSITTIDSLKAYFPEHFI